MATCPTGVFRDVLFSLFSFHLLFFCFVFCNFNLAAKYSCTVLSVTASQSLGLFHCVTNTSFSLDLNLCLSVFLSLRHSHFARLCAFVMYKTCIYIMCIYSMNK